MIHPNTDKRLEELKDLWFEMHGELAGWPHFSKQVEALINEAVRTARIDELEKLKFNRSHNKGELELINNRIATLNKDKEKSDD